MARLHGERRRARQHLCAARGRPRDDLGVANLINFAHGAIFTVGAYVGWICVVLLGLPLPLTLAGVILVTALLGVAIERIGLGRCATRPQIAPLLATIGIGLILDQAVHLILSPNPRALPSQLPDWRFTIGSGTIGTLDLVIAAVGIVSAGLLYVFLRFTKLGWAARATAQDRDAAQQMGVDVNLVNQRVRDRLGARRHRRPAGRHVLQQHLPQRMASRPCSRAWSRW